MNNNNVWDFLHYCYSSVIGHNVCVPKIKKFHKGHRNKLNKIYLFSLFLLSED